MRRECVIPVLTWGLSATLLVATQVCCGSKCGVFGTGNLCDITILNVSPMQLNFGNQTVGTSSLPQKVSLSATGASASPIQSTKQ